MEFDIEIISPEQSFLRKSDVNEVVLPGIEGYMGILKDHIPIISFLKPGIIKIIFGKNVESYYVDDGIVEFKDNNLSILTSKIFDIKKIERERVNELIEYAEKELSNNSISDQNRFILDQKIEVLKSIGIN